MRQRAKAMSGVRVPPGKLIGVRREDAKALARAQL